MAMTRKIIKIQRFFQKESSNDCGPTGVRMILNHFGIVKTLAELKKNLYYYDHGTSLYDNGVQMLGAGLTVTLITSNPLLFTKRDRTRLKNKKLVAEHIDALLKKTPKDLKNYKKTLANFKKFLAKGGDVKIEFPALAHITRAIDAGHLVMPVVYPRAYSDAGDRIFHTHVINGYDEKYIYFVDPLPSEKNSKVTIIDYMYALQVSTCVDIDNGSLLIVKK